eukprot:CAMPEP_0114993716 /NCGR_PEP_ID=MMETSP0216-20121206/12698_1 /TAXON_ID=223996 /ORGANISM="Protocruzia adherens, Strain Boccale" /LENGTH=732 /DNA_ID=CAMNT_0002357417 /DNA_START=141 /DNA_END=2339 /DNA_ORIENTATION=+
MQMDFDSRLSLAKKELLSPRVKLASSITNVRKSMPKTKAKTSVEVNGKSDPLVTKPSKLNGTNGVSNKQPTRKSLSKTPQKSSQRKALGRTTSPGAVNGHESSHRMSNKKVNRGVKRHSDPKTANGIDYVSSGSSYGQSKTNSKDENEVMTVGMIAPSNLDEDMNLQMTHYLSSPTFTKVQQEKMLRDQNKQQEQEQGTAFNGSSGGAFPIDSMREKFGDDAAGQQTNEPHIGFTGSNEDAKLMASCPVPKVDTRAIIKKKHSELAQLKNELSKLEYELSEFKVSKDHDIYLRKKKQDYGSRKSSVMGSVSSRATLSTSHLFRHTSQTPGRVNAASVQDFGCSTIEQSHVAFRADSQKSLGVTEFDIKHDISNFNGTASSNRPLIIQTESEVSRMNGISPLTTKTLSRSRLSPMKSALGISRMNKTTISQGAMSAITDSGRKSHRTSPLLETIFDKFGPDYFKNVRLIFERYACMGTPLDCTTMDLSQYHKFFSENNLFTESLTRTKVDLQFVKNNKSKSVTFGRFVEILAEIARDHCGGELSPAIALEDYFLKFVFNRGSVFSKTMTYSDWHSELQQYDIVEYIEGQRHLLHAIFVTYRNMDSQSSNTIKLSDAIKFMNEFKISPDLCSTSDGAMLFKACQSCESPTISSSFLSFEEFVQFVQFLALHCLSKGVHKKKYPEPRSRIKTFIKLLDAEKAKTKHANTMEKNVRSSKKLASNLSISQLSYMGSP